jgi:hypothetical protein
MRHRSLPPAVRAAALLTVLVAGCMPSQQDVQTAQALEDVAQAFSDMQGVLQEQADRIDSLMAVVVRQDSLLRTLANLAGVTVAR